MKSTSYNPRNSKGGVFLTSNYFLRLLSKKRIIFPTIVALIISTWIAYENAKKHVTIYMDEGVKQFTTHANTVEEALAEQRIDVSEFDRITPSVSAPLTDNTMIDLEQAKEVTISINQKKMMVWTTKDTVEEILKDANVIVTAQDNMSHSLQAQVKDGEKIKIQQAFEVTVIDRNESKQIWSTSMKVSDFLQQNGIVLGELDRVNRSLNSKITPGQKIEIIRVEKVKDVVEHSIQFAVEKKVDASLLKGQEKVTQQGSAGKKVRTYEVVMENGQEVSRKLLDTNIAAEPVAKVVAVGTKVVTASVTPQRQAAVQTAKAPEVKEDVKAEAPATEAEGEASVVTVNQPMTQVAAMIETIEEPAPQVESVIVVQNVTETQFDDVYSEPQDGKELYVTATAYTATCKGCSGITKTGINLLVNPHLKVIAVDPKVIPLGSKVWVEGYGNAIAGDIGGAIKGNKIDLFMPRVEDAYAWGRRTVRIKVLN